MNFQEVLNGTSVLFGKCSIHLHNSFEPSEGRDVPL